MNEQISRPQPEDRFTDIYQSRFLQFDQAAIQLPGDPNTPEDFARAQAYLEIITQQCLQRGIWDVQPADLVAQLADQNEWHRFEVEQEHRGGDRTAEYRAINLQQLHALSRRRVLAFEDTGWEVTQAYRIAAFLDQLVEKAAAGQEEFEKQLTPGKESIKPFSTLNNMFGDIPF